MADLIDGRQPITRRLHRRRKRQSERTHPTSVTNADLGEVAFRGECLKIDRPHRLASTEVFEPFPDSKAVNTLTLAEEGGVTTMTIHVLHDSKEARDAHIASGSAIQTATRRSSRRSGIGVVDGPQSNR